MNQIPESAEKPELTPSEIITLAAISQGATSQQVSDKLSVSKRTIDFRLQNIYRKLNAKNRVDAINKAREMDILG